MGKVPPSLPDDIKEWNMGKRLVDQRNRFGIRKLSVGVCSGSRNDLFLGVTTSYAEEQAENSGPREERVETSNAGGSRKGGENCERAPRRIRTCLSTLTSEKENHAQLAKGQKPLNQPLL